MNITDINNNNKHDKHKIFTNITNMQYSQTYNHNNKHYKHTVITNIKIIQK